MVAKPTAEACQLQPPSFVGGDVLPSSGGFASGLVGHVRGSGAGVGGGSSGGIPDRVGRPGGKGKGKGIRGGARRQSFSGRPRSKTPKRKKADGSVEVRQACFGGWGCWRAE